MPGVLSTASNFICKGSGLDSAVPRPSVVSTMKNQVGTIRPLPDASQLHGTETCNSPVRQNPKNMINKGDSEPPQIPDSQTGLNLTDTESFLSRMRSRIVSCLSWLRKTFFPRREINNSISLARILILSHWIPVVFRSIYRKISNALTSVFCRKTTENSLSAPTVPAVKYTSEEPQDNSDPGTQTTEGDQIINGQALVQTAHGGQESQNKSDRSDAGTQSSEGDQRFEGPAVIQTTRHRSKKKRKKSVAICVNSSQRDQEPTSQQPAPYGLPTEPQSQSDAGTQNTEGDQRFNGPAAVQTVHGEPETSLSAPMSVSLCLDQPKRNQENHGLPKTLGGPEPVPQDKLDPSLSDTSAEKQILVIGCSIVRNVALRTPATIVKCIPGATADGIEFYLKLLSNAKVKYSTIVIHIGSNDARLHQSEITKMNVASVCNYAKTMSDSVVFSGPLPDLTCNEMFSRVSWFNHWLSRWCPENNVGYIDNWSCFWGVPGLLQSDGLNPTLTGAALLSRNLASFVEGQQRCDGPAVTVKAHNEPKPVPQDKLDPSNTGTKTTDGDQIFIGETVVKTVHGGPESKPQDKLDLSDARTQTTEGDQRVDGPDAIQTTYYRHKKKRKKTVVFCRNSSQSDQEVQSQQPALYGHPPEPQSQSDAGTQNTEGEQRFNGPAAVQTVHGEPETSLSAPMSVSLCLDQPKRNQENHGLPKTLGVPEPIPQDKLDPSLSDTSAEKQILVIGCSIVRNVALRTPATIVKCIPGATADGIEFYLKLLSNAKVKYSTIVIHIGSNDARLHQSEITKMNVASVCNYAKTMSDSVVFSGPLPDLTCNEMFSRVSWFNHWLSRWCPENNVGYIDNWSCFWGVPGLLQSDGLNPTLTGAALLSRNLASFVEGQQRFDGPAVTVKAHNEPKPVPQDKLDPSNTGTKTTDGDQIFIGETVVKTVHGGPEPIPQDKLDPSLSDTSAEKQILVIGCSIVRNVALRTPATIVKCIPGATADGIEFYLKLLSNAKVKYSTIVIHIGSNDARLHQSEITKMNVASVCNYAKTMSDSVVFSGPLPDLTCNEMFSRVSWFNHWLSRWCPENNVGYIDNWSCFWGVPGLLQSDGLNPTLTGAALLSRNLASFVEGQQRFDGPAVTVKAHNEPKPVPQDKLDPSNTGTKTTDGDQIFIGETVVKTVHGGPEPIPQDKLDPSLSDTSAEKQILVIGCSIVRNVALRTPATIVKCIPGATADGIEFYLKLLSNAKVKYSTIVIHIGSNDARLHQSEITKMNVASVCNYAKTMSDSVVFSGPLPDLTCNEMFSRVSWFNHWLSRWCPENNVGYIDNWSCFWGVPGLLQSDGLNPTLTGAALLSRNLASFVEGQQRFDGPAVTVKAHNEPKPVPQDKLDPSNTGTKTTDGDQIFIGETVVKTVHGGPEPIPQDKLDPSLSETSAEKQILVIGCSIVRNVALRTPATIVKCIPGATADGIEFYLKLLSNAKVKYSTIVIHIGSNDARLHQSEITKMNVASVCNYAKTMSDSVVFSGPLPDLTCNEMFSRVSWFNHWLSRWCPENNVGYIDNWSCFWGVPGLLQSDGLNPTLTGAALLSRNLASFVEGQQRCDGPAVTVKAHNEPKPVPQDKLDPSNTGTKTTDGDQIFIGETVVKTVHGGPESKPQDKLDLSDARTQTTEGDQRVDGPDAIQTTYYRHKKKRKKTVVFCRNSSQSDQEVQSQQPALYGHPPEPQSQSDAGTQNTEGDQRFNGPAAVQTVHGEPETSLSAPMSVSLCLDQPKRNQENHGLPKTLGGPEPVPQDKLDPSDTGTKTTDGDQIFIGQTVVETVHGGPESKPQDKLDLSDARTQTTEGDQRVDGPDAIQTAYYRHKKKRKKTVVFCRNSSQSDQEVQSQQLALYGHPPEPQSQSDAGTQNTDSFKS